MRVSIIRTALAATLLCAPAALAASPPVAGTTSCADAQRVELTELDAFALLDLDAAPVAITKGGGGKRGGKKSGEGGKRRKGDGECGDKKDGDGETSDGSDSADEDDGKRRRKKKRRRRRRRNEDDTGGDA